MSEKIHNSPEMSPKPSFEYELLLGHARTNGSFKTDEQLRHEYIQLTDKLIYQMTHGVEVQDPVTKEKRVEKPDVVVWLDKSARPLSWLTKELWPKMAPEPGSDEIPEIPDFKFVNIDREQWINTIDVEGEGSVDVTKVDESIIRSLRSVFVSPKDKSEGITEAIDELPSELDNKTIMVVDEVYASGRTLKAAQEFFQLAFPTSRVAGAYWMSGVAFKGSAKGNRDLPIWYSDKDEYGRGVGNRNDRASSKSSNTTQRLGAWFLSTRFPQSDVKALQLRKEFKQLAIDPEVIVMPSLSRGIEEVKKRAEHLNQKPFEEVIKDVQQLKGDRRALH